MASDQPSPANGATAVVVEGVGFNYDRTPALEGLSFHIPSGVSYGLLGPNGAGKSTLIRLLAGLLRPQRGKVLVLGQSPSPRLAHRLGYMPQLSALYQELTVAENVEFFGRISGLHHTQERRHRAEEVIRLVGLWERRGSQVSSLSGGMRQRVSLACAIVHRPEVLLLDEPTVGLDPELRVQFWQHFRELTRQGHTLIISSHTMDDAAYCDRLAFLRQGRLVAEGTPAQLREATGNPSATLEEAFLYFLRTGRPRER